MLKKIVKWAFAILLLMVGLVGLFDALSGFGGKEAPTTWNTNDVDIRSNGNLQVALAALSAMNNRKGVVHNDAASVLKAPWKYYGQLLCYSGTVAVATEYPPDSDFSRALQSNESGEVVLAHDDGTLLDFFLIGGVGVIAEGQRATVCGLPIGRVEVLNRMGGMFTHLVLVGEGSHP